MILGDYVPTYAHTSAEFCALSCLIRKSRSLEIHAILCLTAQARVSRPTWTLVHFNNAADPQNGFEAQWGAPMAENAGAVLLGLVVIILACVSILAASHVW